jgi:hypothetical protein
MSMPLLLSLLIVARRLCPVARTTVMFNVNTTLDLHDTIVNDLLCIAEG